MSNDEDINFHSGDIKKKNLDFNVREKQSTKFATSLGELKKKLSAFPLFKGKNKFITLGAAVVVIALAITLPIVIPRLLAPPPPSEPTPEEQEEQQQIKEDIADTINNIDPNAGDDTRDTILADLDAKIAASTTDEDRYYYIPAKANALFKYGRKDEAIAVLDSMTSEYRSKKDWTQLANNYSFISYIYADSGNNAKALEYARSALAVVDEAASDPDSPENIAGRSYYESQVNKLEVL